MKSLLTHPNFSALWEQIARENNIPLIPADFNRFPDGWPNVFIHEVKKLVEHKEVTYIWDFSQMEDLFVNFAAIRAVIDYYANKVRVILPYFPVGTMERIDEKGEVATAHYFAEIMSAFPPAREGKTSLHIFDIHALVERFIFDAHSVNVEIHTAMNLLKEEIVWKSIVFPDEWALKRFGRDFPENDIIVCSKVREWEKRVITIKEWDPRGKDVIIIDDLIQTWGTIKKTAEKLREYGAKSVSAYATHGVFPDDSHKDVAASLNRLIVTDSIPANVERAKDVPNMVIMSIKPLIEKIIFHEDD